MLLGHHNFRYSTVVSIPACHAGDPGSIPGVGAFFGPHWGVCTYTNIRGERTYVSMGVGERKETERSTRFLDMCASVTAYASSCASIA